MQLHNNITHDFTCESGQVPDLGGCNTAARILAQHIEGTELSPSLTELKEITIRRRTLHGCAIQLTLAEDLQKVLN